MEGLPLPREGATPTHVRTVAWVHAHRAHVLAKASDEWAAEADSEADAPNGRDNLRESLAARAAYLQAMAAMHAQVALALLAVVDTASSGWRSPGA